ncbi:hypothetical protein WJU23_23100 [Prosthecobacter sp. SYSU 5D2]|uniref:hypothetical protein n=1 Tax=Prosthecobacter sp. SYSU 5D2 TaxID=3134134 RepID=UPI0031FE9649
MKKLLPSLTFVFLAFATSLPANPEVPGAVAQSFGTAIAESIVLIKGSSTTAEPIEWTAYARDAFRPADILRISVKMEGPVWKASPAGAGTRILDRVPPMAIDFSKLRYRSADARVVAAKSAALAQTTFASIDYQLAANAETGTPEWGMAMKDDTGYEVGFVVVSAATGAVSFQDWSPKVPASTANDEGDEGERAARAVKRAARKTWNWTDNARKETRGFFRELFR